MNIGEIEKFKIFAKYIKSSTYTEIWLLKFRFNPRETYHSYGLFVPY